MVLKDELDPNVVRGALAVHGAQFWHPIPPGADGLVLTTDSTQALGVKWAAGGGGGGSGTVNSGTTGEVAYYAGNGTAVSGESLSAFIDASLGSAQGDILYRGASAWTVLTPGTNGYFLTSGGASANPSWTAGSGGSGTVTSITAGTGLGGGTITTSGTITLSTVTPALGGTGLTTLTAHGVMVGEGTSNVAFATIGTAGRVLVDQGASADPSFASTGITLTQYISPITTDTESTGTVTCNLATSNWHAATLNANPTIALSNPTTGQQFTIRLTQAASGGPYTSITWFSGITWFTSSFAAPTMPSTASAVMVVTFKCTGSGTYDGFLCGTSAV